MKTSAMITIADLEEMPSGDRACSGARDWFAERFPNGAELREAWDACPSDDWRVWFACHWMARDDRALVVRFARWCAKCARRYADAATVTTSDAVARADDACVFAAQAAVAIYASTTAAYAYGTAAFTADTACDAQAAYERRAHWWRWAMFGGCSETTSR